MSGQPGYYHEFEPSEMLRPHIMCYWCFDVREIEPGHLHQVIPDGCVGLVASCRPDGTAWLTLQGPRLAPLWIPILPAARYWGVRFWPDAGAGVVGRSARELRGVLEPAAVSLGAVAGPLAQGLAECRDARAAGVCWEEALGPLIGASPPLDPAVRSAVRAIVAARGGTPVGELAAAVQLSPRQLQRRFGAAVGLTLKQFARVRRLRESLLHLVEAAELSWSSVAVELGFADQPHLIREFKALAGLSPLAVSERIRSIGRGRVRP